MSGDAFEEVCHDWALRHIAGAVDVGRWWGSKKVRTSQGPRNRQFEADVVPIDADGRVLALGSCKWSDSEHQAEELDKLETIVRMLDRERLLASVPVPLLFFDRTGFSPRLRQLSTERPDVRLVAASELDE